MSSDNIKEMFNSIASNYDKMNKIMTFGMDGKWRRFVISKARLKEADNLLDIATGTGDIIFEALKKQNIKAVGVDFSTGMLDVARERDREKKVVWKQADALDLPFEQNTFDVVTSGYLMRNVGDIKKAFSEQYRVLKKDGIVICLDTTPPRNKIFKPFIKLHFKIIIPLLGKIFAGNKSAYKYLTESTENFKSPSELKLIMGKCGFKDIGIKKFMLNTIAVHWGKKEIQND